MTYGQALALLLLCLAASRIVVLGRTTATTATDSAATPTAATSATATPTAAATTDPNTPTPTPAAPTTPAATTRASTTASTPTTPTTLAALPLAAAAPATGSRRSPNLLSTKEVDSSSSGDRGEEGRGGTPLEEGGARSASRSAHSSVNANLGRCKVLFEEVYIGRGRNTHPSVASAEVGDEISDCRKGGQGKRQDACTGQQEAALTGLGAAGRGGSGCGPRTGRARWRGGGLRTGRAGRRGGWLRTGRAGGVAAGCARAG
ncbi:unnamed protein product [Closterium sp. Yama58-4]|nr:unnamed protein product [Closterium sp. Yama58-4]